MGNVLFGDAVQGLKNQFLDKEIDSSNTVFRIFTKLTVALYILAVILVASSEYLGKPITCHAGENSKYGESLFIIQDLPI